MWKFIDFDVNFVVPEVGYDDPPVDPKFWKWTQRVTHDIVKPDLKKKNILDSMNPLGFNS